MKLIKLTDVYYGDKIYINSNCILSCEHKYNNEFQLPYTKVGLLYQNEFKFFQVKETVRDIQSQIDGKPIKKEIDKTLVGQKIKDIRLSKGMTLEEFGAQFNTSASIVYRWEIGLSLPNPKRLKAIADFAKIPTLELTGGTEQ